MANHSGRLRRPAREKRRNNANYGRTYEHHRRANGGRCFRGAFGQDSPAAVALSPFEGAESMERVLINRPRKAGRVGQLEIGNFA